MITTPQEYFSKLDVLHGVPRPEIALLPSAENICHIDINKRTIEAPTFLSVEKDHEAEVIYFSVDRFVDYMDLATTSCVIHYQTSEKKSRYYTVPFYDTTTLIKENKILFPWTLDATVTANPGTVTFAIQFFIVGSQLTDKNEYEQVLIYNLNTLPATSKILTGLELKPFPTEDYMIDANLYQQLLSLITDVGNRQQLYWTILPADENSIDATPEAELPLEIEEVLDSLEDLSAKDQPVG